LVKTAPIETKLSVAGSPAEQLALADGYADEGETDKAIEQNLAVLDLRPTDVGALQNLAVLYARTGDNPSALRYAQAALEVVQDADDRAALEALIQQLH
jgi:tetratricopeptide (TPR) repeat protein